MYRPPCFPRSRTVPTVKNNHLLRNTLPYNYDEFYLTMPRYYRSRRRFRRRRSRYSTRSRFRRLRRSLKRRAPIRRAILSNRRSIRALRADKEVKYLVGALYPDSSTELDVPTHGPSGQITNRPIYVNAYGGVISNLGVPTGVAFCPDLLASAKGVDAQGTAPNPGGSDPGGARIGRQIKLKSLSVKIMCYLPIPAALIPNGNVRCHFALVLDRQPRLPFKETPQSLTNLGWLDFKETTTDSTLQNPGSDHMYWNTRDPEFRERFKMLKHKAVTLSRQSANGTAGGQTLPVNAVGLTSAIATVNTALPSVQQSFDNYTSDVQTEHHTSRFFGEITFMIKHPYKFLYGLPKQGEAPDGDYQLPENHTIRLLAWSEPRNIAAQDNPDLQDWQLQIMRFNYMTKVRFTDA